jgi:3-keto-disaccharide hydrolase
MNTFSRRHFLQLTSLGLVSIQMGGSVAAAEPAWQSLFDGKTLTGWKAPQFSGQGEITIENGTLVLGIGSDITGMNPTIDAPKMDYEVSLEATRLDGTDFFCGLTLPYGKTSFTIILGGWGGALVGLSSINGDDASENETTKFIKFDTGKWYKVRARVTAEKIEAWLDEDKIINVETDGKKIDMRPGEIELSAPFGLATFRTRGAFKEIKLRKLNPAAAK